MKVLAGRGGAEIERRYGNRGFKKALGAAASPFYGCSSRALHAADGHLVNVKQKNGGRRWAVGGGRQAGLAEVQRISKSAALRDSHRVIHVQELEKNNHDVLGQRVEINRLSG